MSYNPPIEADYEKIFANPHNSTAVFRLETPLEGYLIHLYHAIQIEKPAQALNFSFIGKTTKTFDNRILADGKTDQKQDQPKVPIDKSNWCKSPSPEYQDISKRECDRKNFIWDASRPDDKGKCVGCEDENKFLRLNSNNKYCCLVKDKKKVSVSENQIMITYVFNNIVKKMKITKNSLTVIGYMGRRKLYDSLENYENDVLRNVSFIVKALNDNIREYNQEFNETVPDIVFKQQTYPITNLHYSFRYMIDKPTKTLKLVLPKEISDFYIQTTKQKYDPSKLKKAIQLYMKSHPNLQLIIINKNQMVETIKQNTTFTPAINSSYVHFHFSKDMNDQISVESAPDNGINTSVKIHPDLIGKTKSNIAKVAEFIAKYYPNFALKTTTLKKDAPAKEIKKRSAEYTFKFLPFTADQEDIKRQWLQYFNSRKPTPLTEAQLIECQMWPQRAVTLDQAFSGLIQGNNKQKLKPIRELKKYLPIPEKYENKSTQVSVLKFDNIPFQDKELKKEITSPQDKKCRILQLLEKNGCIEKTFFTYGKKNEKRGYFTWVGNSNEQCKSKEMYLVLKHFNLYTNVMYNFVYSDRQLTLDKNTNYIIIPKNKNATVRKITNDKSSSTHKLILTTKDNTYYPIYYRTNLDDIATVSMGDSEEDDDEDVEFFKYHLERLLEKGNTFSIDQAVEISRTLIKSDVTHPEFLNLETDKKFEILKQSDMHPFTELVNQLGIGIIVKPSLLYYPDGADLTNLKYLVIKTNGNVVNKTQNLEDEEGYDFKVYRLIDYIRIADDVDDLYENMQTRPKPQPIKKDKGKAPAKAVQMELDCFELDDNIISAYSHHFLEGCEIRGLHKLNKSYTKKQKWNTPDIYALELYQPKSRKTYYVYPSLNYEYVSPAVGGYELGEIKDYAYLNRGDNLEKSAGGRFLITSYDRHIQITPSSFDTSDIIGKKISYTDKGKNFLKIIPTDVDSKCLYNLFASNKRMFRDYISPDTVTTSVPKKTPSVPRETPIVPKDGCDTQELIELTEPKTCASRSGSGKTTVTLKDLNEKIEKCCKRKDIKKVGNKELRCQILRLCAEGKDDQIPEGSITNRKNTTKKETTTTKEHIMELLKNAKKNKEVKPTAKYLKFNTPSPKGDAWDIYIRYISLNYPIETPVQITQSVKKAAKILDNTVRLKKAKTHMLNSLKITEPETFDDIVYKAMMDIKEPISSQNLKQLFPGVSEEYITVAHKYLSAIDKSVKKINVNIA